ncbi:MAG: hypothetical protein NTY38_16045, partial [Acidobacteria bacterium]|nr:hypothetical protein [Acidobacteriota bacterium]
MYRNRREAAIAALKEAYKAATTGAKPRRGMALLLVSLSRDPNFPKALYNMGLLCAADQRWQDALSFYDEARKSDSTPAFRLLVDREVGRVGLIAQLEQNPMGQQKRRFDTGLATILTKKRDPVIALDQCRQLRKVDRNRWEAPALGAILLADLDLFAECWKEIEEAARLAPPTRRMRLQSAAELARREANFRELRNGADQHWEKKDYALAAKTY